MKILVVDNQDSFVYNLVQLLKQNGGCRFEVMLNNRIEFGRLSCFDKILLSPGPGLPGEAGDMMRLIRMCKDTHPMLGICLGHQALAEIFGASLSQLPYPKHGHESRLSITDRRDTLFKDIPDGIRIGRYHSWVAEPETFPADLSISGRDEDGNIMAFYHRYLPLHGLQFHPESIISESGQQLLDNWLLE